MKRFDAIILFALINVNFIYSQSLTVTSPLGGEELLMNSSHEIKWVSDGIQNVKIEYSLNNGLDWELITSSFPAIAESYDWILPDSNSTQAIIRISDLSNNLVIDSSDSTFSIISPLSQKQNTTSITGSTTFDPNLPAATLTLTYPNPSSNGAEVWNAGDFPAITWTNSIDISNIDIDFSNNQGLTWFTFATGVPAASGTYSLWDVPNTPSTGAVIRIRQSGGGISSQNSKYVYINAPQFNPSDLIRILPVGNSITSDAFRDEFTYAKDKKAYRYNLWDSLRVNNYNIDFIGHHAAGYEIFPDPENEGVPGINAADTKYLLSSGYDNVGKQQITSGPYLNSFQPEIVLLHIGTNNEGADINNVVNSVSSMISDIRNFDAAHNDNMWIVIALIIPKFDEFNQSSQWVHDYDSSLNLMAQTRLGEPYYQRILVVNMENALDSSDFVDGVHPNDTGRLKMANIWYEGLQLILPDSTATSAPIITSNPDTLAYVGLPYRYDINASGVGAPNYSLTSSPDSMVINLKTGIIDWMPTSTGTFSVSVQAINSSGSDFQNFDITVLPQPTLTNNLVSYWKLDEAGSPVSYKDLPGVNDAVPMSAPTAATGIVKGALSFNGSNKVDVLDDSTLYFYPTESFSVEMFVKTTQSASVSKMFLGKSGGDTKFSLGINDLNQTIFTIEDSTGALTSVTGPAINNGSWHHVVGMVDRANSHLRLYVDGVGYSTFKSFHPSGFLSYDPLTFGYFKYNNFYNGLLDEVAIYNRVLTPAEIVDHIQRAGLYGKGYFDQFVLVKTKVFLEGPYIADGDTMSTELKTNNYIPLTSPYSQDPRTVDSIPTGVVDWVLVELRSSANGGDTIGYKSAFLRSDGKIVGDDGNTEQIIIDVPPASYYIAIRHRNHLAAMSNLSVSLDDNSTPPTLYNFTAGSSQFYGTGGAKEVEPGIWGMWAGDADADGQVNAADRNETWNFRNQVGYLMQDVDLDGQVNAADRNITWNNRNLISLVP